MTKSTTARLREWLSGDDYRSVRIDHHKGYVSGRGWAVVGWDIFQRKVIVSCESGRTLEAAMRRFLRAADELQRRMGGTKAEGGVQ